MPFDAGGLAVDLREQRSAVADLLGGQADGKRQLIDPKARIVGVGLDVPGIELRTEHAGVLAGKAVSVVQVSRQMNAVGHAVGPRMDEVEARGDSTASRPETPCDVEPGGSTLMPVSIMCVACS